VCATPLYAVPGAGGCLTTLRQRVHVHVSRPSIRSTVCAFDFPHFWQWSTVKRGMVRLSAWSFACWSQRRAAIAVFDRAALSAPTSLAGLLQVLAITTVAFAPLGKFA
jgi:hypothetical protein